MSVPADLWRDWHATLRRYVTRRVRDAADADDVLQEIFIKLTLHHEQVRDAGRLAAWLYRVADNAIADHYRARRPWDVLPEDLLAPEPVTDATAALAACMAPMIQTLPETCREALYLSEIEGLPHKMVALRLGLSLPATKSRVLRGREKLRNRVLACCHVDIDADGLAYKRRADCKPFRKEAE